MERWGQSVGVGVVLVAFALGAAAQGPMRVSGGVMAGQIVNRVDPVYPPIARAAHVSGAVVLHAIIGADGTVKNLQVVSGPEMLRQSAIDAVRRWTYKPYLLNGEPREVDTVVTVNYSVAAPVPPAGVAENGSGTPVAGDAQRVRVSGGVMAGQILTKVNPVYPEEAKAKGVSGLVVLRAVIGKDGLVNNLTLVMGAVELRDAALDAVSQWTYKPYLLNGVPVEVDTTVTVNFSLGPDR